MARSDRDDRRVMELQGKGVVTVSYERPWELFPSSPFAHIWVCGWQWPGHVLHRRAQRQLPAGPTHAPCLEYTAIPQCQDTEVRKCPTIVTNVHVSMPRMHRSDVEVRSFEVVISTTASPTPTAIYIIYIILAVRSLAVASQPRQLVINGVE